MTHLCVFRGAGQKNEDPANYNSVADMDFILEFTRLTFMQNLSDLQINYEAEDPGVAGRKKNSGSAHEGCLDTATLLPLRRESEKTRHTVSQLGLLSL